RGIARFDATGPRATFRGWLWTITRNAVLQWRRRREPAGRGGSTAEAQLAQFPDSWSASSAEEPPSDAGETAALLRRAMHQIRPTVEPQTWSAFWQTAVLGRPTAEIAEELGLT